MNAFANFLGYSIGFNIAEGFFRRAFGGNPWGFDMSIMCPNPFINMYSYPAMNFGAFPVIQNNYSAMPMPNPYQVQNLGWFDNYNSPAMNLPYDFYSSNYTWNSMGLNLSNQMSSELIQTQVVPNNWNVFRRSTSGSSTAAVLTETAGSSAETVSSQITPNSSQTSTRTSSSSSSSSAKSDSSASSRPVVTESALPSVINNDKAFNKMMEFVFGAEGGYNPNDCGQPGNYGVRQDTYDGYRNKKGLPKKDVKELTKAEAKDIYYTMYYKASGADKITDVKLAFYVTDAAINMGVAGAKKILAKSGNDAKKFNELRRAKYRSIVANDSGKRKYLNGWLNRVDAIETFANANFMA